MTYGMDVHSSRSCWFRRGRGHTHGRKMEASLSQIIQPARPWRPPGMDLARTLDYTRSRHAEGTHTHRRARSKGLPTGWSIAPRASQLAGCPSRPPAITYWPDMRISVPQGHPPLRISAQSSSPHRPRRKFGLVSRTTWLVGRNRSAEFFGKLLTQLSRLARGNPPTQRVDSS